MPCKRRRERNRIYSQEKGTTMRRPKFLLLPLLGFCLALFTESAQSQNLAMVYRVTPKSGSGAGFETAFRQHMEWRKANNDPWVWETYQVAVGQDLGTYFVRSGDHTWADIDAYEQSELETRAGPHFEATVGLLVESASFVINATDTTKVRMPADITSLNLFWVETYNLKPDQVQAFNEAVDKFHQAIVQHDAPLYYVFTSLVVGGTGPRISVVIFAENWAGFAGPDQSFEELMTATYGAEGAMELFQQFGGSYTSMETAVLRLRRDLSNLPEM